MRYKAASLDAGEVRWRERKKFVPTRSAFTASARSRREQRPSVQLENGYEVHVECYSEHEKAERSKLN